MRILVAGGTGVIGRQLIPSLVTRGHHVAVIAHRTASEVWSRSRGAEALSGDLLDREIVIEATARFAPEVIVHEATHLSAAPSLRHIDAEMSATNELRVRGTDNLLEAAERAGVRYVVAQSFAGWPYARTGGGVKNEEDPLDPDPPAKLRPALDAIRHLEHRILSARDARGLIVRYGAFYGPGTAFADDGAVVAAIRSRRLPLVGDGGAIWSFVHVTDAAAATVLAIEQGATGIYNIVDDEPALLRDWLPELASCVGAKPPMHVPRWLARIALGRAGVMMMTEARGASNDKARTELGWRPSIPSWRIGFSRLRTTPMSLGHALAAS